MILEVRGLHTGYGGPSVVREVDLDVEEGEVVALLGPNGAGKTTTLLTISGLLRPRSGSIRFAGEDVVGAAPHRLARRGMAHVPDDRGLFPGLTVAQHLHLGRRRASELPIDRLMGWFPALEALMERKVGLLSGGEQQMLAVAQALQRGPRLLMVDEMSLGLAPLLVERLLPTMRSVAEESGCGVLLVEQHAVMALQVAHTAYVMSRGEVVAEGPATRIASDWEGLAQSYLG